MNSTQITDRLYLVFAIGFATVITLICLPIFLIALHGIILELSR